MESFLFFGIAVCTAIALVLNWSWEQFLHQRRIRSKRLRIHVNGIRGKSTVTRILAGMLREADVKTFAKTTGSAACTIDTHGIDHSIRRNGSPTILEQVQIIRDMPKDVEALVIECMAINPNYQRICETKIVQSNIGVLTNVREDHQDVLGDSLEQIALNLLSTCPTNGILITAERRPRLLRLIQQVCSQKGTKLVVAKEEDVADADLKAFPYVAFKENIAIGFELAKHLKIAREVALKGMAAAAPDPGVLKIQRLQVQEKQVIWADLFAVNDRESVIACVERVSGLCPNGALKIGLLNNRSDREHRALQFARIAANDIELDYVALLGAYERQVELELSRCGFPAEKIIRLGGQRRILGQELVDQLLNISQREDVVMFGLVNIHTEQAESLREWFEHTQSKESANASR